MPGVTREPTDVRRVQITDFTDHALVTAAGELNVLDPNSSTIATLIALLAMVHGVTDAASPSTPGVLVHGYDGGFRRNLKLDSSGNVISNIYGDDGFGPVKVLVNAAGKIVLGPSTEEVGKLGAGSAEIGAVTAHGDVAHDAADTGNPLNIGGRATNHGTMPTAVANNDRTRGYFTREGVQFVIAGAPETTRATGKYTTTTTDTTLITVATGDVFVVTGLDVMLGGDGPDNTQVIIEFDDATDERIFEHDAILPGSGAVVGHAGGIVAEGGNGQNVLVTTGNPGTGGAVNVAVSGYHSKVGM